MLRKFIRFVLILKIVLWPISAAIAQEFEMQNQYLSGKQESLQIRVHIWGEVRKPGEYLVSDKTNVLELISKAGGPTEFAKLSDVFITHNYAAFSQKMPRRGRIAQVDDLPERIEKFNVSKYLRNKGSYAGVPILLPGDVVTIKRNFWFNWKYVVQIARDVAIVASVYFWYKRAAQE